MDGHVALMGEIARTQT